MRKLAAVLLIVTPVVLAGDAGASSGAGTVLRDCASHKRLTRGYSAPALSRALHVMPDDLRRYSACAAAIRSQRNGLVGAAGGSTVKDVVHNFLAHGWLTRSYSAGTLRSTLRHAPVDVATYTWLIPAVRSQLAVRAV